MSSLPFSLAISAAGGAFTLLRPADWSTPVRRAYVWLPGIAVGLFVLHKARKGFPLPEEPAEGAAPKVEAAGAEAAGAGGSGAGEASSTAPAPTVRLSVRGQIVLALGAAFATAAAGAVSLPLDAALERWLVRRGISSPRRWMAASAFLASLVPDVIAAGRRTDGEQGPGPKANS